MWRRLHARVARALYCLDAVLYFIGTRVLGPLAVLSATAVAFAYHGDTHENMFLSEFAIAYIQGAIWLVGWPLWLAGTLLGAILVAVLLVLTLVQVVAKAAWGLGWYLARICWALAWAPWRLLRFLLVGFFFQGGALALAWALAWALAGAAAYVPTALAAAALVVALALSLWRRLDSLGEALGPAVEALGRLTGAHVGRLSCELAAAWAPYEEALNDWLEPWKDRVLAAREAAAPK